ncbi:LLM class flavin-dependent oxidoreductase [Haloechinothrix salitolerans]|uniref:LLM class flavin-dependent oxidoreductase n=1 Tax=Haloechinothrix salitolerans TaxID=926830 RepID=A0ABW2BYK8_9PSEU
MTLRLSCAFATSPETPEHVALAERLGYHRAWFYDSPALLADVWATMALAATRTERIGLAAGMLVPRVRHPMVTATAAAQIAQLAPGRLALGIGTGFTGSVLLGKKPMRWRDVATYTNAVQTLLRGEDVEWDGSMTRMCHPRGFAARRPLEVPWVVAAEGPKGLEVARTYGNGVACALADPPPEFDWVVKLSFGTVLEDGEPPTSDRAFDAAGFGAAMAYHLYYEWQGADALDQLPGGAQWRDRVMRVDQRVRHFTAHEGHAVYVNDIERAVMPRESVAAFTLTGQVDELRQKLEEMAAAGVTEIAYQPAGPDIPRELTAFADMAKPVLQP